MDSNADDDDLRKMLRPARPGLNQAFSKQQHAQQAPAVPLNRQAHKPGATASMTAAPVPAGARTPAGADLAELVRAQLAAVPGLAPEIRDALQSKLVAALSAVAGLDLASADLGGLIAAQVSAALGPAASVAPPPSGAAAAPAVALKPRGRGPVCAPVPAEVAAPPPPHEAADGERHRSVQRSASRDQRIASPRGGGSVHRSASREPRVASPRGRGSVHRSASREPRVASPSGGGGGGGGRSRPRPRREELQAMIKAKEAARRRQALGIPEVSDDEEYEIGGQDVVDGDAAWGNDSGDRGKDKDKFPKPPIVPQVVVDGQEVPWAGHQAATGNAHAGAQRPLNAAAAAGGPAAGFHETGGFIKQLQAMAASAPQVAKRKVEVAMDAAEADANASESKARRTGMGDELAQLASKAGDEQGQAQAQSDQVRVTLQCLLAHL